MARFILITLAVFAMHQTALASPAQIIIIRHGEKASSGNELNPRGCERSLMIVDFFKTNPTVNQFGIPVAFYGQRPGSESGSIRALQTLLPTAAAARVLVNDNFVRKEVASLAKESLENPSYNGRTVVIAWEHEKIPDLARAFGLRPALQSSQWPDHVYDEAWVLRATNQGVTLQIIPEDILPGDNPYGGELWTTRPQIGHQGAVPAAVVAACQTNQIINRLMTGGLTSPLPLEFQPAH